MKGWFWLVRNRIGAWWNISLPRWLAWKLPRKLVYFASIRLWAHATPPGSDVNATTLTVREALERWGREGETGKG